MIKILSWLEKILLQIISVMFLFIVMLTLVQVFYRYALNNALSWSAELTKIVFVWMTFLGSAVAINRMRHMRISTIVGLLPERAQIVVDIIVYLLVCVFLVVLCDQGLHVVERASRQVTGALLWPRSVFSLPVVLGGGLMFVFCLRVIGEKIGKLTSKREA